MRILYLKKYGTYKNFLQQYTCKIRVILIKEVYDWIHERSHQ